MILKLTVTKQTCFKTHFGKNYTQIHAVFPSINDTAFQRQKEKYLRIIAAGFNTFSGSAYNVSIKLCDCVSLKINVIVETALKIVL